MSFASFSLQLPRACSAIPFGFVLETVVAVSELLLRATAGDRSALGRMLESFRPLLRATARESLDHRIQAPEEHPPFGQRWAYLMAVSVGGLNALGMSS